jgi:hypothetical protein
MIRRLNLKDKTSLYDFINNCQDKFEDFYLTIGKERKFLKGNFKLIEKILKYQTFYAVDLGEIKAILLIYREKTFRPYIRILTENKKYIYDLMRFIGWNFSENELFIKSKKVSPVTLIAQRFGWEFLGSRGIEILLKKNKSKPREIRHE